MILQCSFIFYVVSCTKLQRIYVLNHFLYFLMGMLHFQNTIIELSGYQNVGVYTNIISLCQIEINKSLISFYFCGEHFELTF